jgi:hypothetical protein
MTPQCPVSEDVLAQKVPKKVLRNQRGTTKIYPFANVLQALNTTTNTIIKTTTNTIIKTTTNTISIGNILQALNMGPTSSSILRLSHRVIEDLNNLC